MANPTWRNHYLPQFYLKPWLSGPEQKVWQYKRERSGKVSVQRKSPKETAYERDLYTLRDIAANRKQRTPDLLEKQLFGRIDNDAAPIHARLLTEAPGKLSDLEREAWAKFLNSLLERGPDKLSTRDAVAAEVAKIAAAEALEQLPDVSKRMALVIDSLDFSAMGANHVRGFMADQINDAKVLEYFTGLDWTVVLLGDGLELITSASPLLINSGHSQAPIRMMTLPLSPKRLFVMHPDGWLQDGSFIKELVLLNNLAQVREGPGYIYSLNRAEDGPIVRLRFYIDRYLGQATEFSTND